MPSGIPPQIDDEVAEAIDDSCVLLEIRSRLHIADDPEPFRDAIKLAECLLQRGENRKSSQPRSLVRLLEREVSADDPLHQRRSAVEGTVPSNVREPAVQLDWLEASEARHRRGQSDFELDKPVLDAPHVADSMALAAAAQSGVVGDRHSKRFQDVV